MHGVSAVKSTGGWSNNSTGQVTGTTGAPTLTFSFSARCYTNYCLCYSSI